MIRACGTQTKTYCAAVYIEYAYRLIDDTMEIHRHGLLLALTYLPFFVRASGSLSPRPALPESSLSMLKVPNLDF